MEFQEVMRQWRRRCEHCDAKENVRCYVHGYTCEAFHMMKDCTNFKSVEEEIMKWAAEHPEPVYPTWEEWLVANGIMESANVRLNGCYRFYYEGGPVYNIPSPKMFDPIPADIAVKLGIEPKEQGSEP